MRRRATVAASTTESQARADALSVLSGREAGEQIRYSVAGRVGQAVEPALEPLGFDWRIGVGILGAFAAREVFVSTLGIVFGIEGADEESVTLRSSLQSAERVDGSPLMTPLTGVSLMVFFVLACQCMSTIVVVRKESGTWGWPHSCSPTCRCSRTPHLSSSTRRARRSGGAHDLAGTDRRGRSRPGGGVSVPTSERHASHRQARIATVVSRL